MPWWILEVAVVLVLIAIAVWLGPFIKRFGRAYAADVFHDNPLTGKSYIVLTDIVYYLIFAAYILFMVRFAPQESWGNEVSGLVTAQQMASSAARVGGIPLVIGLLHGMNIVAPAWRQPTVTDGAPADSSSIGSPISSARRMASSMRVSTIWLSGTVLMTSPLTKIWPLPLPEATPRSASRASPGPLTTQPMTATRSGTVMPSSPAVTASASL